MVLFKLQTLAKYIICSALLIWLALILLSAGPRCSPQEDGVKLRIEVCQTSLLGASNLIEFSEEDGEAAREIQISYRTRDCKTSTAEIQNLEIVSFLLWIGSKEEERTRSEGSN
ncbi:hypothetical protein AAG906_036036 [Vitis piasezkii]